MEKVNLLGMIASALFTKLAMPRVQHSLYWLPLLVHVV